jgi:hypothetical protein
MAKVYHRGELLQTSNMSSPEQEQPWNIWVSHFRLAGAAIDCQGHRDRGSSMAFLD